MCQQYGSDSIGLNRIDMAQHNPQSFGHCTASERMDPSMQSNDQKWSRCDETRLRWRMLGIWMALSLVWLVAPDAIAAGLTATTFRYEGHLSVAGQPPTGLYDFRFVIFDAETN